MTSECTIGGSWICDIIESRHNESCLAI